MPQPFPRLVSALQDRYRIERELGAGGMATVYLAEDLKHDRKVALKVLKPELAAVVGAERFLAEIKTTANLQHPNILPLFDSGTADSFLFYVMPYVEGESLRDRLDREHQLPVDDAVEIARRLAEALDYAHRRGVIHRDIKPANVLLLDGKPVLADFGIALAVGTAGGGRLTETGLSLGTPHYMSPEQATGDAHVGPATDIYALGCVLYEMLVGEPPYTGSTPQAVLGKIIAEPAPLVTRHRKSVPANIEATLSKALEKVPADRFRSAADFVKAMGDAAFRHGAEGTAGVAAARGSWNRLTGGFAALAGISLLGLGWALGRTPEERDIVFEITTPRSPRPLDVTVSPDGRLVAFVAEAAPGEAAVIWVRALNETHARPLVGTEGVQLAPFWSPDGRALGYADRLTLKTVAVSGGVPQKVAALPGAAAGGAWNADGVILFGAGAGTLYRVSAAGGVPTPVTTLDPQHSSHRYPVFLPDGRRFLFLAWGADPANRAIYSGSIGGEAPRLVISADSRPAYAEPGFLLFHRQGTLFAQRLDTRRLTVEGDPVRVADDVGFNNTAGNAAFAVSANGVLVFRAGGANLNVRELRWLARDGKPQGRAGEPGNYTQINLAPDDRHVAALLTDPQGAADAWTLDLGSNILSRLTFEASNIQDVQGLPDSRAVVFTSPRKGVLDFYRKVLGASSDTSVFESAEPKQLDHISHDGRFLLYHRGTKLRALPLTAGAQPIALGDSAFSKDQAQFSPDGRSIAYGSNESGTWEVYVASFPAFENRRQVSLGGGAQPRWRADGSELFYIALSRALMAVAVGPAAPTEFSAPMVLFQSPLTNLALNIDQFDVTADGQRFLFLVGLVDLEKMPITVVVNWQRVLLPERSD